MPPTITIITTIAATTSSQAASAEGRVGGAVRVASMARDTCGRRGKSASQIAAPKLSGGEALSACQMIQHNIKPAAMPEQYSPIRRRLALTGIALGGLCLVHC